MVNAVVRDVSGFGNMNLKAAKIEDYEHDQTIFKVQCTTNAN
jgi:hypothetical protein